MGSVVLRPDQSSPANDVGGVAARQGFRYQDHVAAQFVLHMIGDPTLLRVECETADDVLLVWAGDAGERPEYVQVKTTEGDKKWSQTEICARDPGAASRPTSLIEKSLLADAIGAAAQFRIVSRRDVSKALAPLRSPLEKRSQEDSSAVEELGRKLAKKWGTASRAGHDLAYWARNAHWQVSGPIEGLTAQNQQALLRLADQHGANPTHGHASAIYEDLLGWVDRAATASRVSTPDDKVISRSAVMNWWNRHLADTEAATRRTSKPYRAVTDEFLAELHNVTEDEIHRALTGYDARYERRRWRSEPLAEYLANWLPEVALKASELVEVQHLNLREKMRAAFREIKRHREVNPERLLAEILLHAVLRHRFKSEPIACKLFYQSGTATKTFGNAHIVHGEAQDQLWLGRATLATAETYDAVLSAVLDELSHILDPDLLKEEREVILTLREPQHLLPTTLEAALKRNSPVDDLMEVLCIPILVAYDSVVLSGGFAADYRDRLIVEVTERYSLIKPMLPGAVERIRVHIFLIPIECVTTLAEQFGRKITDV
jgi:Cap4 SAVED domain/Cap4 dsDNA endonuclease